MRSNRWDLVGSRVCRLTSNFFQENVFSIFERVGHLDYVKCKDSNWGGHTMAWTNFWQSIVILMCLCFQDMIFKIVCLVRTITVFPRIVSAETIQGRKLFKGGNYLQKYGIWPNCQMYFFFEISVKFSLQVLKSNHLNCLRVWNISCDSRAKIYLSMKKIWA